MCVTVLGSGTNVHPTRAAADYLVRTDHDLLPLTVIGTPGTRRLFKVLVASLPSFSRAPFGVALKEVDDQPLSSIVKLVMGKQAMSKIQFQSTQPKWRTADCMLISSRAQTKEAVPQTTSPRSSGGASGWTDPGRGDLDHGNDT